MSPELALPAARAAFVSSLLLSLAACPSGADVGDGSAGSSSTGAGTTTVSDSSSSGGDASVSASTTVSTSASTMSTTDASSESSSSSTAADSSDGSTTSSCPVGTIDCPCDADGHCDEATLCVDGTCEAVENCGVDGYEPNDSEDQAVDLGELGDGDDPGSFAGELDHATDEDWFTYQGLDNVGLPPGVAPARTLMTDGGLRLCKFLQCTDDAAEAVVTCPEGSEATDSPGGRHGCCANGSIAMPDFDCTGTLDDSARVWIRVDQAQAQCVEYTVSYEF